MADLSIARSALEPFICSSTEALTIKIVRKPTDLDDDQLSFHPEFTHQLFGDNETLFGYKDLKIMLYYSAARLTTFLGMSYKEKVNPKVCDGVEADEVISVISEKLQPKFLTNIDQFSAALAKDQSFRPYGDLVHSFKKAIKGNDCKDRTFEVYKSNVTVPGFQDYHERLQTFVLWYIDAASYIDADDEKWCFFLIYERYDGETGPMYSIVGFTTVYEYYAYPQNIRPRISQMLVLPPFQKNGIGVELLQSVYNYYLSESNIIDITVEDPSDNFVRLRDFVDVRSCLKLKSFSKENLLNGFSDEMVKEGNVKFKLNKRQLRRVYEILRLHVTDMNNTDQYRDYRLDVKKRLNLPFQKEQSDMKKLQKTLTSNELKATLTCTDKEQRLEQLDNNYKDLEVQYRHILERLAWE